MKTLFDLSVLCLFFVFWRLLFFILVIIFIYLFIYLFIYSFFYLYIMCNAISV